MTPEVLDANLDHAVGLTLVLLGVLFADTLQVRHVDLSHLESLGDHSFDGRLVVALQDDLRVTHPSEVFAHELDHVPVLVDALDGDLMREDELRRRASDYDVLHHFALEPGCCEGLICACAQFLHSLSLLAVHSLGRREEVIHAHDGHCVVTRVLSVSSLFAKSLALDALTAP